MSKKVKLLLGNIAICLLTAVALYFVRTSISDAAQVDLAFLLGLIFELALRILND